MRFRERVTVSPLFANLELGKVTSYHGFCLA